MDIKQAKSVFLQEAAREKRIVMRNTIIISVLVFIIIGALLAFAKDALFGFMANMSKDKGGDKGFMKYLPYIVVVSVAAVIFYLVRSSIKRPETVEKAFALIERGEKAIIINEEKKSLTSIFLFFVTVKLDSIYYLTLDVKKGTYTLPVPEVMLTDIKRVLEYGDVGEYDKAMDSIYASTDNTISSTQGQQETAEVNYEVELKPVEAFSAYFTEKHGVEINEMDQKSRQVKNKSRMIFGGVIAVVVLFVVLTKFVESDTIAKFTSGPAVMIGIVGFFILAGGMYMYNANKTRAAMASATSAIGGDTVDYTNFKGTMLTRLAHYIHPNYKYYEKTHVGLPEVLHSGIFENKVYGISGGDQFIGQYNGIPFQSCALGLTYRPNFRKQKDPDDDVFSGNYFVAKFPQDFQTNLLIFPKKSMMGSIKDNSISSYLNKPGSKIEIEDAEFTKLFTVYGDDQLGARNILTLSFRNKLKELSAKNKGCSYISIHGNNIVIASNSGKTADSTAELIGDIFNTTKMDQAFLDKVYVELIDNLKVIDSLKS